MPPGPLYGIDHAVTAPHESQQLTVDQAIAAYTRGGAYAESMETEKGTLEPGKLADAVILDSDPFNAPEHISDIDVVGTILDGTFVHRSF
jgi:predicted amidohydrolase YtcJ